MDSVGTLVEAVRAMPGVTDADGYAKVAAIVRLEEHVADPRVVALFVEVIADRAAYDLARIECVKILHLWPPDETESHQRVGRTVAALLTEDDELVRQYAACSLGPYVGDAVVYDAVAGAVMSDEDIDVRHNALTSIEEAGPDERGIDLLRRLADDPELGRAAARTLRDWVGPPRAGPTLISPNL